MARNFRGGASFARPENALKRADELENVGQKQAALQALHDIITSKKHRTWSKTYESIMFKHIDLCVEMRKQYHAKEALMQYRNMCQQVNINSLEEVIKYFLKKAGEKADEAQLKADAVTIDVEDLDQDASPEDLMLSYVSGEKSKDRTDRELVTPWFKFLWETHRSVLEILRTNPKLEPLYGMAAVKAFQFCLQYKRMAEFRRLCDILRQHLANMAKYRDQRDLSAPESQQLHLDTRFEQLKVACELELWGEAFRSVEDIQALIALGKKPPKQQMMATYYAKLTQIFARSESHLYHAYAWLKLFNFSKTYNKNLTQTDLQMMGCSVLLATLSILPYDRTEVKSDESGSEQDRERIMRMANILGFSVDAKRDYRSLLSRGALLGSITSMNILGLVPAEVKAIHELLNTEFNPLELCLKMAPLLEKLEGLTQTMSGASPVKGLNLAHYVPALKQATVLRLLKQLSEVYSTMSITSLAALVPFCTFGEVEAIIVDSVKFEHLQIRVDHRNKTLNFGSQQLESDKVKNHLTLLAKRLTKAAHMVGPVQNEGRQQRKAAAIEACLESVASEHKRAVARKIMIEKRKEEHEKALLEAEKEEERKRVQLAREAELLEERRRREEIARREKERIEKELEEKELEEARAILEQTKKKSGSKLKDGEKLDKKALMQEALSEKLKEQQELERKLTKMAKQMDHLERARREEEAPFLEAAWQQRVKEDQVSFAEQQAAFVKSHREAWEVDIVEKRRMWVMLEDKDEFAKQVMARREEEFRALEDERERRIEEQRAMRKAERDLARKKEYVRRCREKVEEKIEELHEAAEQREAERKRKEAADKQRTLDEIAAKQRAREEEIERRVREEKQQVLGSTPAAAPASTAAPSAAAPAAAAPASAPSAPRPGAFVPPHLRRKQQEAPPAAAAPAASGEGRAEEGRPEARRWSRDSARESAPPATEDRWGRGGARDTREPAAEGGWGGRRESREDSAGAPPPERKPAGGAYAPPSRRGGDDGGAAGAPGSYRPPAARRGGSGGGW